MTLKQRIVHCYLTTPFRGFEEIRRLIANTLIEMNVEPVLWEDLSATAQSIAEALQSQIQRADFVIADLTATNPNVIFELGYAQALGKQTLIIVQREASHTIPFNLSSHLYLSYDPDQLEQLRATLRVWVPRIIERIDTKASEI